MQLVKRAITSFRKTLRTALPDEFSEEALEMTYAILELLKEGVKFRIEDCAALNDWLYF